MVSELADKQINLSIIKFPFFSRHVSDQLFDISADMNYLKMLILGFMCRFTADNDSQLSVKTRALWY